MSNKTIAITLDKIGICTSIICMLHCAVVPVVLILGADSLLWFTELEWVEHLVIGCSLLIGLLSFIGGYRKHGQHFVPVLFIAGFLLLVSSDSIVSDWLAVLLSVAGALIIIYAHLENMKWKRIAIVR